jgi:GDP-4-dehydro-6-deoxy-D-mannose reductase
MKYLITGITGFAGPHLAKLLLDNNHEVHGIVRTANGREMDLLDILTPQELATIKFHYCDLKHYYGVEKILKNEKFDGIFHLAAQSHPPTSFEDPILTWNENVIPTVNLITAITGSDTRFMYCSTSEVYGDTCTDEGILKEDMPLKPCNPYGASKAAMDLYMQERINNGFINGYITRAFSHTGPRRGKIFSISSDAYQIALMEAGLQEPVLKVGNLANKRAVMDVRDCVRAYYLLMKTGRRAVFNVCGKDVRKMSYFTDCLIEYSTLKKQISTKIHLPFFRKFDIQVQRGDCLILKETTGWTTIITIEKTLLDLLNYWRNKIKQK